MCSQHRSDNTIELVKCACTVYHTAAITPFGSYIASVVCLPHGSHNTIFELDTVEQNCKQA